MERRFACIVSLLSLLILTGIAQAKDEVLAKVNKAVLRLEDFEKQFATPERPELPPPGPEIREKMLDRWIEGELLYQEAIKRKLERSKEAQERIEDMKRQVLIQALVTEEIGTLAEPTEEEVKKYYDEHRAQFRTPERMKMALIQVGTEEEAKTVMSRIEAGEDFAKVAAEVSTDRTTKARGGELGPVTRDRLKLYGPEIVEAAFALESGKLGGPVKGKNGYYLFKSSGKLEAQDQPLAQMQGRIQSIIKMETRRERIQKLLESLRAAAKVEKHPELLAAPKEAPKTEQKKLEEGTREKSSD